MAKKLRNWINLHVMITIRNYLQWWLSAVSCTENPFWGDKRSPTRMLIPPVKRCNEWPCSNLKKYTKINDEFWCEKYLLKCITVRNYNKCFHTCASSPPIIWMFLAFVTVARKRNPSSIIWLMIGLIYLDWQSFDSGLVFIQCKNVTDKNWNICLNLWNI